MPPSLDRHADEQFCYLTTVGRDRSDWVRNLMENPDVRIRIADETFEGNARVIEGEEDDSLARDLLVEKYERDPGKLSRWREESLPVRVEFSP